MNATDHRWNYGMLVTHPLCIALLVVMFLYFVLLEGLAGYPGLWKSMVRNRLRLIDGLPALNILGVVLIVTSPERARFGDHEHRGLEEEIDVRT